MFMDVNGILMFFWRSWDPNGSLMDVHWILMGFSNGKMRLDDDELFMRCIQPWRRMRQMIDAKRLVHDKFKWWFMCHEASTSQVGSVCDSCLLCGAYLLARMPMDMKSAMLRKCSPQGLQGLRLPSRTSARPSLWNSTDKFDHFSMKVDRSW